MFLCSRQRDGTSGRGFGRLERRQGDDPTTGYRIGRANRPSAGESRVEKSATRPGKRTTQKPIEHGG